MAVVSIRLPLGEWFFDDSLRLGRPGGFGDVFEGYSASAATVAIKRLRLNAGAAAHRELRIARELTGANLKHILVPLDSGEDANSSTYFVVMPRAEKSLADEISKSGFLPIPDAIEILHQIAV